MEPELILMLLNGSVSLWISLYFLFILKSQKEILNFRCEKEKSSLSSWLHKTANGEQSNQKGQKSEGRQEESTTTSLYYITKHFGNTRIYL